MKIAMIGAGAMGGTSTEGLNEMEHAGFTSAVIRGLKAGAK